MSVNKELFQKSGTQTKNEGEPQKGVSSFFVIAGARFFETIISTYIDLRK